MLTCHEYNTQTSLAGIPATGAIGIYSDLTHGYEGRIFLAIFEYTMQIHHVGYIVYDVQDTSIINGTLHKVFSAFDPLQEADIVLYKNDQNELIEFIQPLNEKSPVWNFLKKNGNRFHHHCYEATEAEIDLFCTEHGYIKIMGPIPATIFPGKKVIFCLKKEHDMVEFILRS